MRALRRRLLLTLPLALSLAAARSAGAQEAAVAGRAPDPAGAPTGPAPAADSTTALSVRGQVPRPLELTLAELRAAGLARKLDPITLTSRSGEPGRKLSGYRGVPLTDLLDRAGIGSGSHNELRRSYVAARARDGYCVVFSWSELYNTAIGPAVFVLVDRDGAPLDESEGPLALVSALDIHTGPRHVRWLTGLDVQRA